MAKVTIEGIYMSSYIKTSTYDGKTKQSLQIDVYQSDSNANNKMVTLKSDDVALINDLQKDYSQGSVIKCTAMVSAYQNKAFYTLDKFLTKK